MNSHINNNQPGLQPILLEDFILSSLATKNGKRKLGSFAADIKSYLSKELVLGTVEKLQSDKIISNDNGPLTLTKTGEKKVKKRFGAVPGGSQGKTKLLTTIWPSLALGLDPTSKAAARLSRGENLRAVALSTIYGLSFPPDKVTLNNVISALFIRGMSAKATVNRDVHVQKIAEEFGDLSDLNALRKGIVTGGLKLSQLGSDKSVEKTDNENIQEFASRVQALTNGLVTPPLSSAVAISQVYDAYDKKHSDVGSLESFKKRLLQASNKGALSLYPLDEPDALDVKLRQRSLLATKYTQFYLIVRSNL